MTKQRQETATQKERVDKGRTARKQVSRNKLAETGAKSRKLDPVQVLLEAGKGRVPKLLPVKYQRMSASTFAFFRGAVSIMAADLGRMPHTGLTVQLCGDAHLQNMGCYEAPDGRIVFDINDFDETIAGPWEWDVKRMATSIVLAGQDSGHDKAGLKQAAGDFVRNYVKMLEELADEPILTAARFQIHRLKRAVAISAALQQAQRAQPGDLVKKYTEQGKSGKFHFKNARPALWPLAGKNKKAVLSALSLYRKSVPPDRLHLFSFFQPLAVAFKVVGTGSVGLRDYVVLMEGNGEGDPLFLQIKQEVASAYAPYLKCKPFEHEGRRVAEGQRKVQPISDLLLGWTRIEGLDYLVRQLNDHKGSVDLSTVRGKGLNELAAIAGALLARGHARSGDAMAIKGFLGDGDGVSEAITEYALDYAELAQADFEQFTKAIDKGRVRVAEAPAK